MWGQRVHAPCRKIHCMSGQCQDAAREPGLSRPAAAWCFRCSACRMTRGGLLEVTVTLAGTSVFGSESCCTVLLACYTCTVPMGVGASCGPPYGGGACGRPVSILPLACSAWVLNGVPWHFEHAVIWHACTPVGLEVCPLPCRPPSPVSCFAGNCFAGFKCR